MPAFLLAGAIIGLLGVVLFGAAHAAAIVPIWSGLLRGVPFGLAAGITMGWALFEMRRAGRFRATALSGFGFGALLALSLLPMTALAVLLRKAGLHTADGTWEPVVELFLVVLTGAGAAWAMTRRPRPSVALAVAGLVLALAQGGPIPVTNSIRAAGLWASLCAIYSACGLGLSVLAAVLSGRSTGRPDASPA